MIQILIFLKWWENVSLYLFRIGWIDISNLLAKVPIVNNNIFVKILQLPHDDHNKLFNKDKLTAIGLIDPRNGVSNNNNNSNGHPKPPPKIPVQTTNTNNNINNQPSTPQPRRT